MKPYTVIILLMFELARAETWHSFQGYEYVIAYSPYVSSYAKAKAGCAARNATVANVKTTEIQNFLIGIIGNLTEFPYSLYIGASRIGSKNEFQWTDGTSVNVTQWVSSVPNYYSGNENCVIMGWLLELDPLYKWFAVPCAYSSRYVCQRMFSAPKTDNNQNFSLQSLMSTASSALQNISNTSQSLRPVQCQYNFALLISAIIVAAVLLATFLVALVVFVKLKNKVSQLQHKTIFDRSQKESNHENSNPAQYYINEDAHKAPAAASFATYVNIIDNQHSVKNQRKEDEYIEFNE